MQITNIKMFFTTLLLFALFSIHLKPANNCFQYIELPQGVKSAIEDYSKHCDNENMLTLMYQWNNLDSIVFTLVGDARISSFMESPTMYFSLHKGRMILVYNGKEEYNPDAFDMNNIIRFLSHFDKSVTIINSDWEKKELTTTVPKDIYRLYDPPFVQYHVNSKRIINKHMQVVDYIDFFGYPDKRYQIKRIFR